MFQVESLKTPIGIIKIARIRHLGNASIIIAECIALRDDVVATIYNVFTNLEIEGDSKIIIKTSSRSKYLELLSYL